MICNLISCSSASTENYTKIVKSWEGSDINDLIMSWGPPSDEYTMPNYNKMYTWLWVGEKVTTVNYLYYLNMITSNQVTYYCKTIFTANENGKIISWQWEGNACKAEDPDEK